MINDPEIEKVKAWSGGTEVAHIQRSLAWMTEREVIQFNLILSNAGFVIWKKK